MPFRPVICRSGCIDRRSPPWFGLIALLMGALAAPVAWGQQPQSLKIAVLAASPPFSDAKPDGTLTGFNVEIMGELCRVMRATCTFDAIPFADILEAVASGRYDVGMSNFLKTPERERKVLFSAPYWRSSSSLVGPAGGSEAAMPAVVAGRRVAVLESSRQHVYMKSHEGSLKRLVVLPHLTEVWESLQRGEVDLALTPTLAALDFLLSEQGRDFMSVGAPLSEGGLGGTVHIVMPKDRVAVKAAIDDAIAAIRSDGSYQDINRRYFPFDVY